MTPTHESASTTKRKRLVPISAIALGGAALVAAILIAGGVMISRQLVDATDNVNTVLEHNKSMARAGRQLSDAASAVFREELPVLSSLVSVQRAATPLNVRMVEYLAEIGEVEAADLDASMNALRIEVERLETAWPERYPADLRMQIVGAVSVLEDMVAEVSSTDSPAQLADIAEETREILLVFEEAVERVRLQVLAEVEQTGVKVERDARATAAGARTVAERADELSRLLETVNQRVILNLLVVLATVVVIQVLVFMTLRRRLGYMARLMTRISDGDVETRVSIASDDNVGQTLDSIHRLTVSMRDKVAMAQRIAARDLSGQFESTSTRDSLGNALAEMLANLSSDVSQVARAASALDGDAQHMAAGSTQLAQGASEQAATISQIATSVSQLSQQTRSNLEQAQGAHGAADDARELADVGASTMSRLQDAMREANDMSREIASVVTVIDEIAFQTNLLALNATIEAARAGEAGAGFTVVAKEVRALAQRCADSARDTSALLERSARSVRASGEQADETARSFTAIAGAVTQVAENMSDIVRASEEQAGGIEEISKGLTEVNDVTRQTRIVAERNAGVAGNLTEQARALSGIVSSFKVPAEQL